MELAIGDSAVEVAYENSQSLGGISVFHAEVPDVLGRGFTSVVPSRIVRRGFLTPASHCHKGQGPKYMYECLFHSN